MGKKSIFSTIVGISGGIIFGYALGYAQLFSNFSDSIPNLAEKITISFDPRVSEFNNVLVKVNQELELYILQFTFDSLTLQEVGIILITVSIIIAYITGETSWLPWRKKKDS